MALLRSVLFAFVVFVAQNAHAKRSPYISYISQEQIKDIGGTAELVCTVQYPQDYPVVWTKLDEQYGTKVAISSLQDSRFSLRHDKESSTLTLQIKDVQETDSGIYTCQIPISVDNKISAEVYLKVRKPPIISDNST